MPLLVIAIAPDETGALSLREWDLLRARRPVYVEASDHPLGQRLRDEGQDVVGLPQQIDPASDDGVAIVDPRSPRLLELARAGADVHAGSLDAPDSLTAAHGAKVARRAGVALARFVAIMARLRSEDGCPWDREQSHKSLQVHLVEEAHEVIDAIDRGELTEQLEEELGDLLLQVAFHAQLALDDERFDIAQVADAISGKLVHRHPHVFGDLAVSGASEVVRNWEAIKAAEKERTDPFADIPAGLPALLAAYKTQKRGAGLEREIDGEAARAHAAALLGEPVTETALGDLLFSVVAIARSAGVDPEGALRAAIRRFQEG